LTGSEAKNYQTLDERSFKGTQNNITKSNKSSNNEDISHSQSSITKRSNSYSLQVDEKDKKRRFNRLFYFVNLIKRSSYAATLIVMMVVVLGYVTFKFCFIFWFYVFNLDLEYHLSQLEWICAAFVVLHHLDDAKL